MGKQYTADKIIISGGTSSQFLKGDGSLDSTVYQSELGYTPENLANKATSFSTVNDTLYPTIQAVKTYADSLVAGLLDDRGSYNASINTFPTTGGSGTAGAVLKGDFWYVSAAGTLGGVAVNIGDSFRALVDTPGQTATNWSVLEGNLGFVPYNSTNPAGYTSNLGTVTSISMTVPTGLSISGSPITSSGTLGLTFTAGYSIPTDANQTNWDTAYTNRITSLTVTGNSGSATLVSNVLNIPTYTLSGLGGQASSANLTSLASLAYVSGAFVKMTSANTFTLDTSTYYLSSNPNGYTSNTGTVTNVSALTLGTTGTDLSSTVATGTTTPVITLNVPTASATNRGALSSDDWTTFNNKQNALTNPITGTGTGTTNYMPKFTGTSTLGNSIIYDNGTSVGIGTTSLPYRFIIKQGTNQNIQFRNSDYGSIGGMLIQASNDADTASIPMELGASKFSFNVGNVLIGTTTDDGVNKLQVNGVIKTSTSTGEFLRSDTTVAGATQVINIYNSVGTRRMLLGYGSTSSNSLFFSNDADGDIVLRTNATERINISSAGVVKVNNLSGSGTRTVVADASGNLSASATSTSTYKVYTALVTQSGTSGPTATVLENTLGGTVVLSRVSAGQYKATLTGAFTANKTTSSCTPGAGTGNNIVTIVAYQSTANEVVFNTSTVAGGGFIDGVLSAATFEIRVYN